MIFARPRNQKKPCKNRDLLGAPEPKLCEHRERGIFDLRLENQPCVIKTYSVTWKRSTLDVAELVTKRYIEGIGLAELAEHYGVSDNTIQSAYLTQKKNKFNHKSISPELKKKLLKAAGNG